MRALKTIVSIILALSALLVTSLVVQREFFKNNSNPDQFNSISADMVLSDTLWQTVSASRAGLDVSTAPVKIVGFYDYECPFCAEMQVTLDTINARYPNEVTVLYRHYPLPHHTGAYAAAISAECAFNQGVFETFHELLFAYQSQLSGSVNWRAFADKAQIQDKERFVSCVVEQRPAYRIAQDTTIAGMLNLEGVPTLVINGEVYYGVLNTNELDSIIQTKLDM